MTGLQSIIANMKPYHDLTDFAPAHCIQVNNCGIKEGYPIRQDIYRPKGRQDYSLLYVASGWIEVSHQARMNRLTAGKWILYMPGVPYVNLFSSEGDPTVYYVYFTGHGIHETMALFETDSSLICDMEHGAALQTLFHQMVHLFRPIKALNGRHPVSKPGINGLLLQILDLLLQSREQEKSPGSNTLIPAMNYLVEHFREPITLEECARTVQLSVGRFGHLFTEYYGISPHRFLLSLRLDEARDLLINSGMSINRVAEKTGFLDPCYFSRLFKKYTGLTPKEYRSQKGGETP
ncbi:MAG: helix-turn-helix transcriptional regulator [Clostridia bacterium]|nr:helix-turn-helix transcriptional regulator [Clostridia bacterium]